MIKQSIARKLPVLMQDSAGAPVTGLAFGDVSVKYAKEGDTSLTTKVLAADPVEWFEIGQGLYDILFTIAELNTIGFFKYVVTGGAALQYSGLMQISANLVDDVNTNVSTRASEVNATTNKNTVVTEIDSNETKIDTVQTSLNNGVMLKVLK
jgi:hypothetical protein